MSCWGWRAASGLERVWVWVWGFDHGGQGWRGWQGEPRRWWQGMRNAGLLPAGCNSVWGSMAVAGRPYSCVFRGCAAVQCWNVPLCNQYETEKPGRLDPHSMGVYSKHLGSSRGHAATCTPCWGRRGRPHCLICTAHVLLITAGDACCSCRNQAPHAWQCALPTPASPVAWQPAAAITSPPPEPAPGRAAPPLHPLLLPAWSCAAQSGAWHPGHAHQAALLLLLLQLLLPD